MYPIIERLEVNANFRYLWLKYVTGVNLNQHCARSLIGNYSKVITKDTRLLNETSVDEYDTEVYYLCGVTERYVWSENFHLAFRFKEGGVIEVLEHGVYIRIRNAERLPIIPVEADKCDSRHINEMAYYTCRNWQFANWYKNNLL